MRYPTNWISITQGFHVGKCLDFGWCSHHNQDIYACDDGVVMPLEKQEKGGNVIYIQHDNGMVSCYAHLKAFAVKKGQRVSLGQKIGIMGKTGKGATGEHLHFGLFKNYNSRYKNSTINPFDYLEVYPEQFVREDALKKYGSKIKYYNPTPTTWTKGTYQLLKEKAVRKEPRIARNIKKVKECSTWAKSARDMLTQPNKPNADAYLKVGSKIDISEIIDEKGRIWGRWGKTGNDYIVLCNIDGTPQAIKIK